MSDTALSELARVVAEVAEALARVDPGAQRLAHRARELCRPLRPGDPARWAVGEPTVTVEVDVPARVVAETLANERTGAVVVVSSDGPIGIVAERDLVSAVAAGQDLDRLCAADLIAPDLLTADERATIADVAALMIRHRVRHVPLLEGRQITGVVSSLDLLRALGRADGPAPSE